MRGMSVWQVHEANGRGTWVEEKLGSETDAFIYGCEIREWKGLRGVQSSILKHT